MEADAARGSQQPSRPGQWTAAEGHLASASRPARWIALAVAASLGCSHGALPARAPRPVARLSANPRVAFAPVRIEFLLRLQGGQDTEDYYCPAVGWSFGDGSTSAHESDCEPWVSGLAIERLYQARHLYKHGGDYVAEVGLWKRGQRIVREQVALNVRPGLGEFRE